MPSTADRPQASLIDEAERWLQRLSQERFLRATFSHGGELRLHFGNPIRYDNSRLAGRTHGEWVLALRGTPWVLVSDGSVLSRSHDEQRHALRNFEELEGKVLTEARLRRSDAAVTLRFGDDYWFMALTEPRPRAKQALDLWELLTPEDTFVLARPDRTLAVEQASARPAAQQVEAG